MEVCSKNRSNRSATSVLMERAAAAAAVAASGGSGTVIPTSLPTALQAPQVIKIKKDGSYRIVRT